MAYALNIGLPLTSSKYAGVVVAIPIFPFVSIRIRSAPPTPKIVGALS